MMSGTHKHRRMAATAVGAYLVPHVVLILLPIAVSIFLYAQGFRIIQALIVQQSHSDVASAASRIASGIDGAKRAIETLSLDPRIARQAMLSETDTLDSWFDAYLFARSLPSLEVTNDYIAGYLIYLARSDTVWQRHRISLRPDVLMRTLLRPSTSSSGDWLRQLSERRSAMRIGEPIELLEPSPPQGAVAIAHSLAGSTTDGRPNGTIVVFIRLDVIEEVMGALLGQVGRVALVDQTGAVLSETNRPGAHADVLDTVTVPIDGTPWTIHSDISRSWLAARTRVLRGVAIATIGISITIAFLLSFRFSERDSSPLRRVVSALGMRGSSLPKGTEVADTVSLVVGELRSLQDRFDAQRPTMRAALIGRLLAGEECDDTEVALLLPELGIRAGHDWFACAIVRLSHPPDDRQDMSFKSSRMAIVHAVDDLLLSSGQRPLVHHHDAETAVLVFRAAADHRRELDASLESVITAVDSLRVQGVVAISVGKAVRGIANVASSLVSARRSMRDRNRGGVAFDGLRYPVEMETMLLNAVVVGNESRIREGFDELRADNELAPGQEPTALVAALRNTIHRAIADAPAPVAMSEAILQVGDDAATVEECEEALIALATMASATRTPRNVQLVGQIVAYVDREYTNPQLSLALLATRFDLSDSYVSELFKTYNGNGFQQYLTSLRMREAARLLLEGADSVDDVARAVGYVNRDTFTKAFRRMYSVSPSRYREHAGGPQG